MEQPEDLISSTIPVLVIIGQGVGQVLVKDKDD